MSWVWVSDRIRKAEFVAEASHQLSVIACFALPNDQHLPAQLPQLGFFLASRSTFALNLGSQYS